MTYRSTYKKRLGEFINTIYSILVTIEIITRKV